MNSVFNEGTGIESSITIRRTSIINIRKKIYIISALMLLNLNAKMSIIGKPFLIYSARETCGSWLGPSFYFDVYNYEGALIYKVQGPAGYPCECTRDNVAVFKVHVPGQFNHQISFKCTLLLTLYMAGSATGRDEVNSVF